MAHTLYGPHIDSAFADEDTSVNEYDDDSLLIAPRGDDGGKFAGGGGGGDTSISGGAGGGGAGGGLGSLADELAGAMYDSDEEYDEEEGGEENVYGEGENERQGGTGDGDGGGGVLNSGGGSGGVGGSGTVGGFGGGTTNDYDESEYGDPEDLTSGISLALEDKIGQIENLAIRNKQMMQEEDSEIIPKLMEGLQSLPPQSNLELGSTRLITAHTALATHIFHQAHTLRNLSLSINVSNLPPDDTLDLILPLIDLIPRPASSALAELASLHAHTISLVSQLSFLSDTLHMVRQSSIAANRKLRVSKEACADWKSELEQIERSRRWIEDGDWDAKCRNRNAANVCAEVTGGFEDVCRGFEERLKAQGVVA